MCLIEERLTFSPMMQDKICKGTCISHRHRCLGIWKKTKYAILTFMFDCQDTWSVSVLTSFCPDILFSFVDMLLRIDMRQPEKEWVKIHFHFGWLCCTENKIWSSCLTTGIIGVPSEDNQRILQPEQTVDLRSLQDYFQVQGLACLLCISTTISLCFISQTVQNMQYCKFPYFLCN